MNEMPSERRKRAAERNKDNATNRRLIRRAYDIVKAADPATASRLISSLGGPWLGYYPPEIVKEAQAIVDGAAAQRSPTVSHPDRIEPGAMSAEVAAYINGLERIGFTRGQIAVEMLRGAASASCVANGGLATLAVLRVLREEIEARSVPRIQQDADDIGQQEPGAEK